MASSGGRRIDPSVLRRLRWVEVGDPALDIARFPDFMIIGPQRTGTSWLHVQLRRHPQIFLAHPKELYFFSRLHPSDAPRRKSSDLGWYLRFFRDPPWRAAWKQASCLWRYRRPYEPRVRGEATASYATLDREMIAEITTLNPHLKAVLMIRNPVDRAWSHAVKKLVRKTGRRIEEVPVREFEDFFARPHQLRCARFVESHDNWAACLEEGHLFVGRFDLIRERPRELLLDVMRFLGVDPDPRTIGPRVDEPVNATAATKVPERYRKVLEELLAPELARLDERFGLRWPATAPHAGPR